MDDIDLNEKFPPREGCTRFVLAVYITHELLQDPSARDVVAAVAGQNAHNRMRKAVEVVHDRVCS